MLIAELREKGELNHHALIRLNKYIRLQLFTYGILVIFYALGMYVLSDLRLNFLLLICISFIPWFFHKEVIQKLAHYPILFAKENVMGKCVHFSWIYWTFMPGFFITVTVYWKFDYKFNLGQDEFLGSITLPIKRHKFQIGENENITIFYDPADPRRNLPYIPSLYSLFNIRKRFAHDK